MNHTGDTAGEWYGNTACGTLLAIGGTLYGPANIPAGSAGQTAWTPISQSAVTGTGTNADPYQIVTTVGTGNPDITLTQTDLRGREESYQTDISHQQHR